jgi:hypothetical protein
VEAEVDEIINETKEVKQDIEKLRNHLKGEFKDLQAQAS